MFLRGRPVTMHIPDGQKESYSLEHKVALPDRKLKLQWVYPWQKKAVLVYKTMFCFVFLIPFNRWENILILHWSGAATPTFLLNKNTAQVRLPWAWLPLQPLPAAHRRDRLLQRLGGGAVQHRGAAAAPLPGPQRWCQMVRIKLLSVCLSSGLPIVYSCLLMRWLTIYLTVNAVFTKLKYEKYTCHLFWVTLCLVCCCSVRAVRNDAI